MFDRISNRENFTLPTIWPEILIKILKRNYPIISFAKTKAILLQTPSIVVPVAILQKFDFAYTLIRSRTHQSIIEAGDILAEVDLFFIALEMAWDEKTNQLERSKLEIITLYKNGGWI
ncbi:MULTISPECIES: hypothetical protein [Pseudomonas]|uniref:hypothetical protein n=1 Tax=Pseudomonas TaxID=286 RepID=UPI002DBEE69F|nr:hypothetical protein [Pseudomonas asiatica]MEB6588206.1 hypothetical protein [Pseudomonas asiatica]